MLRPFQSRLPRIRPAADRRDRNDGAVRRKALPLIAVLTLAAAACGGQAVVIRPGPTEDVFVPQVVDFEGEVGTRFSLTTDADGNPHLAYFASEEEPKPGETPAQEDPTAPELPAVKHAHLVQNVWTRSFVAEDQRGIGEFADTDIAVDGEGVHHIAWTAEGTLFYSSNAEGEFSEPQELARPVFPRAVAVAADAEGTPWIAFLGAGVQVATLQGDRWVIEDLRAPGLGNPVGLGIGVSGTQVLVAYGDRGRATVARRADGTWTTEIADQEGGYAVDMALDGDGNPHLAYLTDDGEVRHAHSIAGGPWEVSTVTDRLGADVTIAVDQEGVHHVAWQTRMTGGLGYANNQEGEFQEEEVPGADGGITPSIGAGRDGVVYLAWFDTEDTELIMAVRSDREPLLAFPSPSVPAGGPTGPPTGPPPCEPSGTTLTIAAPPGAFGAGFDKDCLAAPAGEAFTIEFDNSDTGQTHNVGIYGSQGGAAFFQGELITAPDTTSYDVEAVDEPGQYFFQCDVHPTSMTGTFVVQ
jgi:plastocyanin